MVEIRTEGANMSLLFGRRELFHFLISLVSHFSKKCMAVYREINLLIFGRTNTSESLLSSKFGWHYKYLKITTGGRGFFSESIATKGAVPQDFRLQVFFMNKFPPSPEYPKRAVQILVVRNTASWLEGVFYCRISCLSLVEILAVERRTSWLDGGVSRIFLRTCWLSCHSLPKVLHEDLPSGMGLARSHPPHAYWPEQRRHFASSLMSRDRKAAMLDFSLVCQKHLTFSKRNIKKFSSACMYLVSLKHDFLKTETLKILKCVS